MSEIIRATLLFLAAGLAEIGGGWAMWQWLREGKGVIWGVAGGAILILYGILPTLQREASFGRIYAAYGGFFIVFSLLWGMYIDGWKPDRYDWIGAAIAILGATIILWGRRIFQ